MPLPQWHLGWQCQWLSQAESQLRIAASASGLLVLALALAQITAVSCAVTVRMILMEVRQCQLLVPTGSAAGPLPLAVPVPLMPAGLQWPGQWHRQLCTGTFKFTLKLTSRCHWHVSGATASGCAITGGTVVHAQAGTGTCSSSCRGASDPPRHCRWHRQWHQLELSATGSDTGTGAAIQVGSYYYCYFKFYYQYCSTSVPYCSTT